MGGEKKEHKSIKQHVTVCYGIWQYRNLPTEYLRSYICFRKSWSLSKRARHNLPCDITSTFIGLSLRYVIEFGKNR